MNRARSVLFFLIAMTAACTGSSQTETTPAPDPTSTASVPIATTVVAASGDETAEVSQPDAGDPSSLTVSGHGAVYAVPETMVARLTISVLRPTITEAADVAGQVADNVRGALLAAGVDRSDIQSTDYSINSDYDYRNNTRVFEGFRVRHTYTVRLELASAGRTIDAAAASSWDALEIDHTNLSLEADDSLIAEARTAAWEDALAQASDLAATAGLTIGTPLSITESSNVTPPDPYWYGGDGANGEEPFEAGRLAVSVTLRVEFATSPAVE